MKRLGIAAGIVLGLLVGGAWLLGQTTDAGPAAKKAPRPTTAIDQKNCVTAECHVNVKNYKVVHGPVNVNACDACHKLTDASKHTFVLAREKKDTCTFCHKVETEGMPVVHKPVATGDCLPCHNPHGGATAKFIRAGGLKDVCTQCHKDPVGNKKNVHGPVAAGACEACHAPHAAKYPKLLAVEGKQLCFSCHKEMGDQLKTAKVTHKPVMDGECSQCHDPHASDYPKQVKAAPFDLCTNCHQHQNIKKVATESKYKHSIVTQEGACSNCHTPHGGSLAKLMKAEPVNVCLKCHDKDQKTPDGRTVASVAGVRDPKLYKHGPVRDGSCGGCHNVHGSDVTRLLNKPYPETFYQAFAPEKYDLCFSCHDKRLVTTQEAEGLTGFRNGTENLHFVHVNKERGRNCRACHETHASQKPLHIRESVPYGKWSLPINYKKAADGGSCAPGCHQSYQYDRKNPVEYKHAEGASTPAPAAVTGGPASAAPATQKTR